jgi:hypothetical protein
MDVDALSWHVGFGAGNVGCRQRDTNRFFGDGRSHSAHGDAQALVWDAMASEQSAGLQKLWADVRQSGRRWVYMSRRYDETSMKLHLPESIRQQWVRWTLEDLGAERFLPELAIRKFVEQVSGATHGLVHILTQRMVLRLVLWRFGGRETSEPSSCCSCRVRGPQGSFVGGRLFLRYFRLLLGRFLCFDSGIPLERRLPTGAEGYRTAL